MNILHKGRNRIVLLLAIFVHVFVTSLYSQDSTLSIEHLGVANGMSANSTLCILQDSKGFMWFGSQYGLNRYDGYSFKVYLNNPFDSTSISDPYVFHLCEDKLGGIWICTTSALDRYDPRTETFRRFPIDSSITSKTGINRITYVFSSNDSLLWFGTNAGRVFVLPQDFYMKNDAYLVWSAALKKSYHVASGWIVGIFQNRKGEVWIGDEASNLVKAKFESGTWSLKQYPSDETGIKYPIKCIREILSATDAILVGTSKGLYVFHTQTGKAAAWNPSRKIPHEYRSGNVKSILESSPGQFWIAYEDVGLMVYDSNNDQVVSSRHNPHDPRSISTDKLFSLCKDRSENIWIGAMSGELNKVRLNSYPFKKYIYDPVKKSGLTNSYVSAVFEDRNNILWVGTRGGGLNKGIRNSVHGNGDAYTFSAHDEFNNQLVHRNVKAIKEDRHGNLWIGLWPGGLYRYSPDRKRLDVFKHNPADSSAMCSDVVRTIFEDSKGRLWVGTTNGGLSEVINYADANDKNVRFINYTPSDSGNSISQDDIFTMSETNVDGKFLLWIGTYTNGLNCFDPASKKFTLFKHNPNDATALCSNNIRTLFTDSKQNLWIGTADGLALLAAEKQKNFQRVGFDIARQQDGLSSNEIEAVLEDSHGNLWISTANGITRYNPELKSFLRLDESKGLPGNEFVLSAACKSNSGEMFFGGIKGLVQFHPDRINDSSRVPTVAFTSFKVFEKELKLNTAITESKEIILDYTQNYFSIEFAALDYQNISRNRYAYKLEGLHNDWVYSDTRHYVSFSHLPAGEYVFRVKGCNSDGVWNDEGASLAIAIIPPFWERWWFMASIGFMGLAGIVAFVRYATERKYKTQMAVLEREQHVQHEREKVREQIARDLHDEIGSNLSSIALISQMLKRTTKGAEAASLQTIHTTAQDTAEAMRDIVWFTNPKYDTLQELMLKMEGEAERLLTDVPYGFKAPDIVTEKFLPPEFRRNIFLIFKESLHNAVKHSQATQIEILLEAHDGYLRLTISDNGKGFVESELKRQNGLRNIRSRAEQIGAALNIESELMNGTSVKLSVRIP